jgi:hypothetical protein
MLSLGPYRSILTIWLGLTAGSHINLAVHQKLNDGDYLIGVASFTRPVDVTFNKEQVDLYHSSCEHELVWTASLLAWLIMLVMHPDEGSLQTI